MKYLELNSSCGSAAVVNALRVFGCKVSEARVRSAAGTDWTGTGPSGIVAALRKFGLTAQEFTDSNPGKAWLWLHGAIGQGRAVIVAVDASEHWVKVIGRSGERVVVFDNPGTKRNMYECGVHVLNRRQMLRRWLWGRGSEFYGI